MNEVIKDLFREAESVPYDSKQYWKLRCIYCEKMIDPTYSEVERSNCYQLHKVLERRYK